MTAQVNKDAAALEKRNDNHIKKAVIDHLFCSYPKDIDVAHLFNLLIESNEQNPINDYLFSKLTLEEGFSMNSKESLGWLVSGEYSRLRDLLELCSQPLQAPTADSEQTL